jgi:hypothetical protein
LSKDRSRLIERIEDRSSHDRRPDFVHPEFERGDDPKIPATPSDRPEQIIVLRRARGDELGVRCHDIDGKDTVASGAECAHQPTVSATQ